MPAQAKTTTAKTVVDEALNILNRMMPTPTYTKTVKDIVDAALIKLKYVSADGTISSTRSTQYYAIAIPMINEIQTELLKRENPLAVPVAVTALTSTLSVSDSVAIRVMPTALAMQFALADSVINTFDVLSSEYYSDKLPSVQPVSVGDTNMYYSIAIGPVNEIQSELAKIENPLVAPTAVTALSNVLSVTDDTAMRVMPLGVAMRLAQMTGMTNVYSELSVEYYKQKLPSVQPISTGDTNKYYSIALPILNEIQGDLIKIENPMVVATQLTALTDTLSVTDDTAVRVMPTAVAMKFAEVEGTDKAYQYLSAEYYKQKLPSIQSISTGDINKYVSPAPAICTTLQLELLKCEGVEETPDPLTNLDDALTITDSTATGVMPWGLAARWSLTENANVYNDMYANYMKAMGKIVVDPTPIIDVYNF